MFLMPLFLSAWAERSPALFCRRRQFARSDALAPLRVLDVIVVKKGLEIIQLGRYVRIPVVCWSE
jgi:hypothetical protein